jgi:hypothetical protein
VYTPDLKKRRLDNLYILTVTKGDNRAAVMRSWNAHKRLESIHPAIKVHVLTDEPNYIANINCFTCPLTFKTKNSMYKARALEWYRRTIRYTQYDWVLHLDEESVIDEESLKRVLDFIWYEKEYHWGQGVILYNQHRYWKNWVGGGRVRLVLLLLLQLLLMGPLLSRWGMQSGISPATTTPTQPTHAAVHGGGCHPGGR